MMLALKTFKESIQIFFKDKWVMAFSFVPVGIGGGIYYFIGNWIYTTATQKGKLWINSHISSETWGAAGYYLLLILLTVLLLFVINYTFVLVVSVLAGPFNDLISSRVERVVGGETPEDISQSIKRMIGNSIKIVINEIKKLVFILGLTILALLLSLLPVLTPLSIVISAILVAVGFLDYNWSRHDMPASECKKEIRKNFFAYGLSGWLFMVILAVPILNLFALPYGVVYYSVLWTKKKNLAKIKPSL